jgi:hypothetical protein
MLLRCVRNWKASTLLSVGLLLLALSLGLGAAHSEVSEQSKVQMVQSVQLHNVDVQDPEALEGWARGMCKGQTVTVLAAFYNVENSARAVANVIAKDLPGPYRRKVVKACLRELED